MWIVFKNIKSILGNKLFHRYNHVMLKNEKHGQGTIDDNEKRNAVV